jgi:hypothetical protein
MTVPTLVLRPDFPFVELYRVLAAHGWTGGSSTAYAPLVPGEPELARWTKRRGVIDYTCNSAIWFRTLQTRNVGKDELSLLSSDLPHLGESDVLELIDDADDERVLLGLFAAHALGATVPPARMAELAAYERPLVRDTSRRLNCDTPASFG